MSKHLWQEGLLYPPTLPSRPPPRFCLGHVCLVPEAVWGVCLPSLEGLECRKENLYFSPLLSMPIDLLSFLYGWL